MAALFLSEADVDELLPMDSAIEAIELVFRKHAMTEVANIPRGRARTDHAMLHIMGAAAKTLDAIACKVYTSARGGVRFLVHLYSGTTGELLALIEADRLGQVRTGAVSGLATRLMAREDANTVGIFGSGKQARTQLEAICEVRDIVEAYVYSPTPAHRDAFAQEMSAELGVKVVPIAKPELAAEDKDILVTATTSVDPVLNAEWISPGTHICAVGSNFIGKAEVDIGTIRACDPVVVDDKEQARHEAGDLVRAVDDGVLRWSEVHDLSHVLVGRYAGRHRPENVTLFKSVGAAFEDLAVARLVYERALAEKRGIRLPF